MVTFSPEFWAILITAAIQIAGLATAVWMAWQNGRQLGQANAELSQLIAAVSVDVLQGRRIEEVLPDEVLSEMLESLQR